MTGDGKADMIARNAINLLDPDEFQVSRSTGTAFENILGVTTWTSFGSQPLIPRSAEVRIADLDGDGLADLVARDPAGSRVLWARSRARPSSPPRT